MATRVSSAIEKYNFQQAFGSRTFRFAIINTWIVRRFSSRGAARQCLNQKQKINGSASLKTEHFPGNESTNARLKDTCRPSDGFETTESLHRLRIRPLLPLIPRFSTTARVTKTATKTKRIIIPISCEKKIRGAGKIVGNFR